MLDYVIIGGGITGVTLARLLAIKKKVKYQILEAASEAGGLCRTKIIDNHIFDIGGSHFLHSKYKEVYDFIFSHIPESEFNYFDRVSKIKLENEIIDYPIESNIWQLELHEQVKYLISVAQAGELSGKSPPTNYEEWIKWKLGNVIADKYMIPYNKKIWGVSPSGMDIDWLHKIPRLDVSEIFASSLNRRSDNSKFPSHQGFYYPKSGGFQRIFNSIYSRVSGNVILNFPVTKLVWKNSHWLVNGTIKAKNILNTVPWNHIYDANGKPDVISDDISKLRHNSLVVSLYEQEYNHNYHWLYLPDERINHHREFFVHNFAPHSKSTTLYTETNIKRWIKGQRYNRKNPISEHINQEAYPIPVLGHSIAAKNVMAYYQKRNMFGVGRWGQWQYFNSDVCIKEAIDFVEGI